MKFAQRSAGNAYMSREPRIGAALRAMVDPLRTASALILTVVAFAATALPAPALAAGGGSSPVLSGYAGPGSGEQAVLGGGVVGGGSGGGGGSNNDNNSGASGSLAVRNTSGSAPASGSTASTGRSSSGSGAALASTPHHKKSSSSSSTSSKHTNSSGTSSSTTSQASSATAPVAARPGAPAVVAYRNTSGEVSGFPLTAGGVLIVLFGLLAVVLAVLGLRMLMGDRSDNGPPISQVAVR